MQCGPIRFSADAKTQIQKQSFLRYLVPRFTSYRSVTDNRQSFALLSQSLAESELRNTLIIEDVVNAVTAGRKHDYPDRQDIACKSCFRNVKTAYRQRHSTDGRRNSQKLAWSPARIAWHSAKFPSCNSRYRKIAGEGLTIPRLDTLFLAPPISWKGVGCPVWGAVCNRENEGKSDVLSMITIMKYTNLSVRACIVRVLKGYSAMAIG